MNNWYKISGTQAAPKCMILALLSVSIAGCAYMRPFVPLQPAYVIPTASGTMPELELSIAKIDGWISETQNLRNMSSHTLRALNLATFGLGLGAGVATIYGAHRDTIMAFGLGAAGSYSGATLFVPADQATLYGAAITALICVRTKSDSLRAAVESTERRRNQDLRADYLKSQLVPIGCTASGPQEAAFQLADRARANVLEALEIAKASDNSAAASANSASFNIINRLNIELAARAASSQAILDSAKSSVAMAAGFGSQTFAPGFKVSSPGGTACAAPSVDDIKAIESRYKTLAAILTSALNASSTLDTACVLSAPTSAALAVSQEQITLAKDSTYVLTVSGGRPPYSSQFANAQPVGVTVVPAGDKLIVTATSNAVPNTYQLDITDSTLIANKKTVTVKVP